MDLKKAIIVGGVILGVFTGWIILSGGKKQEDKAVLSTLDEKEKISLAETTKEFTDAVGFKFSYPENLTLAKNDNEKAYSSLTITSEDFDGNTSVLALDATTKTIDEYVKQLKEALNIKKVEVAGMDARQFTENNKLITAGIDNGVLFTFTTDITSHKGVWEKVHEKIVSSFTFVPPEVSKSESTTSTSSGSEEEILFEGEETIE